MCDFGTIQEAVDAAGEGDVIKVATGEYTDVHGRPAPVGYPQAPASGIISQVVYISKTVTIRGGYSTEFTEPPDPEINPTTLDAQGQGRVLFIGGQISPTIEGLRITGGNAAELGGDHDWSSGGGVYVFDTAATISNCVVYSNTADAADPGRGSGLYLYQGEATLMGNTVRDNITFGGGGGGLYLHESPATLIGNTVQDNTISPASWSSGGGGGLYLHESPATLIGNTVQDNTTSTAFCSGGGGGGLYLFLSDAMLSGNTIISNTASTAPCPYGIDEGGGLFLAHSTAVLVGNTVLGNTASVAKEGEGGGLYIQYSAAELVSNTIQGNTASIAAEGRGGGLFIDQFAATATTLVSNTIQGNTASTAAEGSGGGLHLGNSDAILSGNTIVSNTASLNPVAISKGGGMSVWCYCSFTLTNNVVADNHANTEGSGLWFRGDSMFGPAIGRLSHNTIADNRGCGQGVYAHSNSTLAFTNTILAGHSGVGIFAYSSGEATLEATLWHGNGVDTGGDGTIITGTVNIWDDPGFVDPGAGDYHIAPGSGAIDTGVDAGVAVDIDGEPRPSGAGYDIGADELLWYPRLVIIKWAIPDPVRPGSQLTYSLRVTNSGTVSLTVTITDILPTHVTPTGILTWTPPQILPGDTWTETVVVTVEMGYVGLLTNVVQVTTGEGATGAYTSTVTVEEEPISGLEASNDSPTSLGNPTTLTATVTSGTNVSYTWSFGDSSTGSGNAVSHIYPEVGIYTALVTASNPASELTATTVVTLTEPGFYLYLPVVVRSD